MRRFHLPCLLTLATALCSTGCVHEVSGAVEPGTRIDGLKAYHVVQDKPTDVTTALRDDLVGRGFTVTAGPESAAPATAQCKVLSKEKWMWDITMYPLEIKVEMIEPKTGALLASGRSYRSSMARKSPREMAREVFDRIFSGTPGAPSVAAAGGPKQE